MLKLNKNRVKDCGMNFDWSYFGMTLNDAINVSNALRTCRLSSLNIQSSSIDDDKSPLICHVLLTNTHISHLDSSRNKIGSIGATGFAKC